MTNSRTFKAVFALLFLISATTIASSAQTLTTLAKFWDGRGANPNLVSLAQGWDGYFYGTTVQGGRNGGGTVFGVSPGGTLRTLYSFCGVGNCLDGREPYAGVLLAADGNFYGTTSGGGANSSLGGTIFRISPEGKLTTLYSFCALASCYDGQSPYSNLTQGVDGNLYGTTFAGGQGLSCPDGCGTVFKISPSGELTTLHSFCQEAGCPDGSEPIAGLTQDREGNFYGTTSSGGSGNGTVFTITSKGELITLQTFDYSTEGASPYAGLVLGTDGNFYGATSVGGVNGAGSVFRISPGGQLTVLDSFGEYTNGIAAAGTLIQATDGNLYGTTSGGGPEQGWGTIFRISPEGGTILTLHTFCANYDCADGTEVWGGLLQATSGSFLGTTSQGGFDPTLCYEGAGCGTIYELNAGLGPFVAFVQPYGKENQTVQILGQGFSGTTSVSLNGTPASFRVVSDTFIEATVPAGATTGYVTVTTPGGTLTSNVPFRVLP